VRDSSLRTAGLKNIVVYYTAKPIRAGQHHTHLGAPGGLRGNPIVPGTLGRLISEDMQKTKIMSGGNRGMNE
jgi:hypothetical protein